MRIFFVVVGILLLFPGACFSILGFAIGSHEAPGLIGIGVMILVVAVATFFAAGSRPKE